ncbi:MAG: MarR family winged helix-turn-helix transcriptional regulator [Acidimicrobiales bacterium]|jgi:DNA-binding MarR family transcriptional regulator
MGATRWLDDAEMRSWVSLIRATRRLMSTLDAELQAGHGISLGDYELLARLSESDGERLRMSDLAQRLSLSPSGLTRRMDGLVKAGLVERQRFPEDHRSAYAVMTAAGRTCLERAAPDHVASVRRCYVDRFSHDELASLAAAFDTICAACDEEELGADQSSPVRAER